jgi:hypothetical protein
VKYVDDMKLAAASCGVSQAEPAFALKRFGAVRLTITVEQ